MEEGKGVVRVALCLLACLSMAAPAQAQTWTIEGHPRIVDGDTIVIGEQDIRLAWIDAPEIGQPCKTDNQAFDCGERARSVLAQIVGLDPVSCTIIGKDKYGRFLGLCSNAKADLNEIMIRLGWAMDYRKYSKGHFAEQESLAREARFGIWQTEFMPPWEWRHQ